MSTQEPEKTVIKTIDLWCYEDIRDVLIPMIKRGVKPIKFKVSKKRKLYDN